MSNRLLKTLMLLALSGACTIALADDPPSLVGRVALAQGRVSISDGAGEPGAAQVNWPVTAGETITTARGARTELQVGSAFIRLDGDSSLEVIDLDEDSLRLRLHYGSASIRIDERAMLDGFELSTPEGRVRMHDPGRLRVDTQRMADTSSVTVFDGAALVEGGGASLTVRAGKRAELQYDDVRTVAAGRDEFDDWVLSRDRAVQAGAATHYVSTDMTGYADLDRYGSWRTDPEYGALWTPSAVGPAWVPYSDGRWVWLQPWGWTWVDNAPWGYAPFHYGRWVYVNRRWCWAPGRREHRPVWAPALVGWVGGAGWSAGFKLNNRHQALPARGWYPLSPREHFVPPYRLSDDRLRRLNGDVRQDFRHRRDEHRRAGLTVVPQDQFGHHGQVVVPQVPRASVPAQALNTAPGAAPPAPPLVAREHDWRRGPRHGDDRDERAEHWRNRAGERDHGERRGEERAREQAMRQPALSPQPQPAGIERRLPPQPVTVMSAPPGQAAQPPRPVVPEHRPPPQPVAVLSVPPAPVGQPQPMVPEHRASPQGGAVQPGQQPLPPQRPWRMEHRERAAERVHQLSSEPGTPAGVAPAPMQAERAPWRRRPEGDFERGREMAQPAPGPVHMPAPPPAPLHVPAPGQAPVHAPPPVTRPMPAPPAPPPPAAGAPAPAQAQARGHGPRGDDNPRQHER
jgi:hypothetical protein